MFSKLKRWPSENRSKIYSVAQFPMRNLTSIHLYV